MRCNAQPDGRLLDGTQLRSCFSPLVDKSVPKIGIKFACAECP